MAVLKYHALDRRDHGIIKGKRSSPHSPPIALALSDMQSSKLPPVTPVPGDLHSNIESGKASFQAKEADVQAVSRDFFLDR